jgi:hypothetical protein
MMENNKKVLFAYTVKHNEDGSVDVLDAGLEGAEQTIEAEQIYEQIKGVAAKIDLKRFENAAFVGAYNGVAKFFQDVNQQQAQNTAPKTDESN